MGEIEAAIAAAVDERMAVWMGKFEELLRCKEPVQQTDESIALGRRELYNAKEAAAILGCSAATVRKLIREGKLLSMTEGGAIHKIPRSELEKMIKKGGQT